MKVKVVERKVKKGISLILEIYWGYQKDISGKIKHNSVNRQQKVDYFRL